MAPPTVDYLDSGSRSSLGVGLGAHQCPRCRNMLKPRIAKGGQFPGHAYVHVSHF